MECKSLSMESAPSLYQRKFARNITSIRLFFDSSLSIIKDMSGEKGIINTFITDSVSALNLQCLELRKVQAFKSKDVLFNSHIKYKGDKRLKVYGQGKDKGQTINIDNQKLCLDKGWLSL